MNKRLFKTAGIALSAALLWSASSLSHAISIVNSSDADALADSLLGGSITRVGSATLVGTATQQGSFSDGTSTVGMESGVVLSTGDTADIPGPNGNADAPETRGGGGTGDDINTILGTPGDTDLDTLTGGFSTFDANVLEFDFQFGDGSGGGDLSFRFVFASEEYIDFIDTSFNDVFGFFVDGVNVALVPGTSDPITINTINDVANSGFYRNNVANTNGIPDLGLDIAFDGLTTVITASASGLGAGTHTMKFAVADTSDGLLDAAVFIEGGSFTDEPPQPPPPPSVPGPASWLLLGMGLLGLAGRGKQRKRVA